MTIPVGVALVVSASSCALAVVAWHTVCDIGKERMCLVGVGGDVEGKVLGDTRWVNIFKLLWENPDR
jgi:hypothetical protein